MKKLLFWIFLILTIIVGILAIIFIILSGQGLWEVPIGVGIGFVVAEIPIAFIFLSLYLSTYAFDFSE